MRDLAKHYSYSVAWSSEDDGFIATCAEFPSLSAYAQTASEAVDHLMQIVDESIEWLESENKQIPKATSVREFSGNISLRIPPTTHRLIALAAASEGVSLNQYITSRLDRSNSIDVSSVLDEVRSFRNDLRRLETQIELMRAEDLRSRYVWGNYQYKLTEGFSLTEVLSEQLRPGYGHHEMAKGHRADDLPTASESVSA